MPKSESAFAGQLYQLRSTRKLTTGAYVAVNGPWDRYGVTLKSEQAPDGQWLNLIRGVAPRVNEKVVASF